MGKQSVLVVLLIYLMFTLGLQAEPVVKISQGFLQGIRVETRNGRNISGFIGIPYAEPPIGELRFRSPVPAKEWNKIYLADKEGNACPQPDDGTVEGNEDCLFLNVFTPKMEFNQSTINSTLLPVMVWIHGGGFHMENSNLNWYGPKYLMDKDVIFVSINYRLGILGFLSTGDEVAPGNFGLKDQNLALKWVQKNIHIFGGDPNRVTLFGESAGGASVTYHALSDKSKGLFHQYIIQSGNALVPWGYRDRSSFKSDVNLVATKVGCPTNDSKLLINCLRKISYDKLVNLTKYEVLEFPEILWIPTNEVISEDAFLTDSPQHLIEDDKLRDYPFMSGAVRDEGLYITAPFHANYTSESVKNVLENCINGTSNRFFKSGDLSKFRTAIVDYYFNRSISPSENELLENFTKFAGDSQFVYPNAILVERMAKSGKSPIYLYMFGYHGKTSYLYTDYGIEENIGVTHADDLLYIFSGEHSSFASAKDNYMIDLMVDLWTSFAINGKPTSVHLSVPNLWQPYTQTKSFLQIGNIFNNSDPSVTLEQNYFTDRMNFWKKNFPLITV